MVGSGLTFMNKENIMITAASFTFGAAVKLGAGVAIGGGIVSLAVYAVIFVVALVVQ